KISLAILRTASRRSLGLSAGSSSTLVTWSLYSRSWSVGAPARAGVDTPTTRMNPRRIAAIVFIMIGSIQRRGARAPAQPATPPPSSGPGPPDTPRGRRARGSGGRRPAARGPRGHRRASRRSQSGRRHPNDQDEPEEDCRHRLHHDREYTTARRAGSRTTSHAAAVIRARAARYTARTPSAWIRRPPASGPRTPRTPASVAPI